MGWAAPILVATIRAKKIVAIKRRGKRRPSLFCSGENRSVEAYKNIGIKIVKK